MKLARLKYLENFSDTVVYNSFASPIGELVIFCSDTHLLSIYWEHEAKNSDFMAASERFNKAVNNTILLQCYKQLDEYFLGRRREFTIPIKAYGSDFQQHAWQELQRIPYGKTISYGEQAHRMGDKNKARAVGGANGLNPISIIVPCHRVVGSNGKLTGFGGGMDRKKFLLDLESD